LLIKYIKSVLWTVAERLSYTENAWCLKVKYNCKYLKHVSMLCNTDPPVLLYNLSENLKLPHFWGNVFPTCYTAWGLDTAIKTNNMVSWESRIFSN